MLGFVLAADFGIFPDNHSFGKLVTVSSIEFGGQDDLFVNDTANERGLQFGDKGVTITLPVDTTNASLRIGTFNIEVQIHAFDRGGNNVAKRIYPKNNGYANIQIAASPFYRLELTGGGSEAIIPHLHVAVCAT